MVLHLMPASDADPLEALREEIRILPTEEPVPAPRIQEWVSDNKEQAAPAVRAAFPDRRAFHRHAR